jgi:hypothetical protein
LRVVLDQAAAAELREAAVFYEDCREGLGQEFLSSVEAAIEEVGKKSGHFPISCDFRDFRGHNKRFFGISGDTIKDS